MNNISVRTFQDDAQKTWAYLSIIVLFNTIFYVFWRAIGYTEDVAFGLVIFYSVFSVGIPYVIGTLFVNYKITITAYSFLRIILVPELIVGAVSTTVPTTEYVVKREADPEFYSVMFVVLFILGVFYAFVFTSQREGRFTQWITSLFSSLSTLKLRKSKLLRRLKEADLIEITVSPSIFSNTLVRRLGFLGIPPDVLNSIREKMLHFIKVEMASVDKSISSEQKKNHKNHLKFLRRRRNFEESEIRNTDFRGKDLSNLSFAYAHLVRVDARGAKFVATQLPETKISYCRFENVNLRFANLSRASIMYSNFANADFANADLRHAKVWNSNLQQCNLSGTKLKGANLATSILIDATLTSAIFDTTTIMPDGQYWESAMDISRFTNRNHPNFWEIPETLPYWDQARTSDEPRNSVGLTKSDLVARIAAKIEISKEEAQRTLDAMLDVVTESLSKGDNVTLTGFGTFEVRDVKARTSVNPRTKERIQIPPSKRAVFKPGAVLKRSVDG